MKQYNVAVVGATGLVGGTFLQVLAEENFPIANLRLFASAKSAGKVIAYQGKEYVVEETTENSFDGIEIALAAPSAPSGHPRRPPRARWSSTTVAPGVCTTSAL